MARDQETSPFSAEMSNVMWDEGTRPEMNVSWKQCRLTLMEFATSCLELGSVRSTVTVNRADRMHGTRMHGERRSRGTLTGLAGTDDRPDDGGREMLPSSHSAGNKNGSDVQWIWPNGCRKDGNCESLQE